MAQLRKSARSHISLNINVCVCYCRNIGHKTPQETSTIPLPAVGIQILKDEEFMIIKCGQPIKEEKKVTYPYWNTHFRLVGKSHRHANHMQ